MNKIRYIFFALFSLLLICCCKKIAVNAIDMRTSEQVVFEIVSHSVTIDMVTPFGARTIGSGVVVNHPTFGYAVLTAEHVALAGGPVELDFRACPFNQGSECFDLGRNFLMDRDSSIGTDWAIFLVDAIPEGVTAAPIRTDLPSVGEKIILSSIPLARTPWVSQGYVAWVWSEMGSPVIGVDGFAFFGSSGGGVYDGKGRLMGLLSAIEASEWGPLENKLLVVPIQNMEIFN